jgi:hypothetical protein
MGDQQQLSRSRDPCHIVWLPRVFEATVEMLHGWVVGEEGQTFIFDALRDSLAMSWQDYCDWNTKEPSTTSPVVEMREKTSSLTTRTGLDS